MTSLQQLAALGLNKYALVAGGASENTFRSIVDKQGKFSGTDTPWRGVENLPAMISLLLGGDVDYLISWKTNYEYWLHTLNLCDKVVSISLPKIEVGGWYYGENVPEQIRLGINRALLAIWRDKETEVLLQNFRRSPLSCGVESTRPVDYRVILILLSITVLPLLLGFVVIMCLPGARRARPEQLSNRRRVVEANGNGSEEP